MDLRFRTLAMNGRTQYFATQEECEERAQHVANRTGKWCGVEMWDESHPQDELNAGWALIGTRDPERKAQT